MLMEAASAKGCIAIRAALGDIGRSHNAEKSNGVVDELDRLVLLVDHEITRRFEALARIRRAIRS